MPNFNAVTLQPRFLRQWFRRSLQWPIKFDHDSIFTYFLLTPVRCRPVTALWTVCRLRLSGRINTFWSGSSNRRNNAFHLICTGRLDCQRFAIDVCYIYHARKSQVSWLKCDVPVVLSTVRYIICHSLILDLGSVSPMTVNWTDCYT